jgi:SAM-dependent methyltransferase
MAYEWRALWIVRALRFGYHLVKSFETRRSALLMLRRPRGLFQPYGYTQEDRYPEAFDPMRGLLADRPESRILSFGCATGEEVFTLARLFPQATVKGIDIDAVRIQVARRQAARLGIEGRVSFACASDTTAEPLGHYDAIFAMAVFRHGALQTPHESCKPWVCFADFEESLTDLARCLKPGGYLALRYANFRFADTRVAAGFERVHTCPPDVTISIYGPDDHIRPGLGDDGIFRKKQLEQAGDAP